MPRYRLTTRLTRATSYRLAVAGLFLLALLLPGCGDSASSGAAQPTSSVKSLDEILASGPIFTNVTGTSVTVLLDTKIPVVCAAAYGLTTSYGHLATDSDMAGGAHTNHHPVLNGLQPGTEYHLRLQGVGPDGTLYQSKDYTFRTASGQPQPIKPEGSNVALLSGGTQVVGVSSIYGGGDNNSSFGANKAFDGDPGTQWSTNGDGNKAWIEIKLPQVTHVTNIGFWTRTMGTSAEISTFRVIADGAQVYGPFKLKDAAQIYYFSTDFTAERLRFEAVETTGGNTGAVEIEVYGQPQ